MILIISACEVGSCDPGCTGAGGRGSRAHIVGCWHAPQATAPEVTNHNASCGVEAEPIPLGTLRISSGLATERIRTRDSRMSEGEKEGPARQRENSPPCVVPRRLGTRGNAGPSSYRCVY